MGNYYMNLITDISKSHLTAHSHTTIHHQVTVYCCFLNSNAFGCQYIYVAPSTTREFHE